MLTTGRTTINNGERESPKTGLAASVQMPTPGTSDPRIERPGLCFPPRPAARPSSPRGRGTGTRSMYPGVEVSSRRGKDSLVTRRGLRFFPIVPVRSVGSAEAPPPFPRIFRAGTVLHRSAAAARFVCYIFVNGVIKEACFYETRSAVSLIVPSSLFVA